MSTATPTRPLPDLNAIHRTIAEARARAAELEAREQALALTALTGNDDDRTELASVQAERDACLLRVRDGDLAIAEHARLSEQAIADAEQARIDGELARCRELMPELRKVARQVDTDAGKLAASLAAFARVSADVEATASRAKENHLSPPKSAPEAALVHALRAARVPIGMIEFGGIAAKPAKLADSIPPQPFERR